MQFESVFYGFLNLRSKNYFYFGFFLLLLCLNHLLFCVFGITSGKCENVFIKFLNLLKLFNSVEFIIGNVLGVLLQEICFVVERKSVGIYYNIGVSFEFKICFF